MSKQKPIEAIQKALSKLVVEEPWFASLALRLRLEESTDGSIQTLATDGLTLWYNPKFLGSLPQKQQLSVVCHEVLHCAFRHMTRRGSRIHSLWNIAGDYVINAELKASGFELPAECLYDAKFDGMTTEQVYSHLEKNAKKIKVMMPGGGECPKDSNGIPNPGCCKDAPNGGKDAEGQDVDAGQIDAMWEIAVAQATAVAQKAGKLPASIARHCQAQKPRQDWRSVLHRYLTLPGDYSWTRPNRRFVAQGLYLPGSIIDSINCVVIAVDTSGSVDQEMLNLFAGEVRGILANAGVPRQIIVTYCDAKVHSFEEVDLEFDLKPQGGGGTAFQPVFDKVREEGVEPDVLFYLTDLEGPHPQEPSYPTVWVVPETSYNSELKVPFGELVRIDAKEKV